MDMSLAYEGCREDLLQARREIEALRRKVQLYQAIVPKNIGNLHDIAWEVLKDDSHAELRRRTSIHNIRTLFDALIPALSAAIANNPTPAQVDRSVALVEALREIEKGQGAFSSDPLTHAGNCIDDMKAIARAAIARAEGC